MPVTQCANGHFYDDAKYTVCPHCEQALPGQGPGDGTREPSTRLHGGEQGAIAKKRLMEFVQSTVPETRDEKTIGIYAVQNNLNPVVGWLVCVEGSEKGRDYRLHAGRNFAGRSLKMDISLPDDPSVHRDHHCSIIYEPTKQQFLLAAGDGQPPFHNGEMVSGVAALHAGDRIEIGGSMFSFVPFCGEDFKW